MHPLSHFNFCPHCGSKNFAEHNEKSKKCTDCGFNYYLNPSAAVVAVIEDAEGRLLVARRAKQPAQGTLDLPGGFADLDECIDQTVRREVLEETGLLCDSIEFLFSLPNRYEYSGMVIPTMDCFFRCRVSDFKNMKAMDDVSELIWLKKEDIRPEDFGLISIRNGIEKLLTHR